MARSYPNPPIIEAVVEFKFPAAPAKTVEQVLRERLGTTYELVNAQDLVEAHFAVDAQSVMTSAKRTYLRTVLVSSLGTRMLTCADGALGVHVLRPYPGWSNFLDQITEAVDALPEGIRQGPLEAIALRYINQFMLDGTGLPFDGFLSTTPARVSEAEPVDLIEHQSFTRSFEPESQTTVDLRTVILSGPSTLLGLDILVHRKLDCPFSDWHGVLAGMHERENQIFEDCITDAARERFQ